MGLTAKDVMRILKKNGWVLDRINGSHYHFSKAGYNLVIVPFHGNVDMGHFAIDILVKEAKIDPKSFRR